MSQYVFLLTRSLIKPSLRSKVQHGRIQMAIGSRYKTGQKSPETGQFVFDGYLDGTNTPAPTQEERVIPIDAGDTFPPISSTDKGCWWKRMR